MVRSNLVLEMVPPLLSSGAEGLAGSIDYVRRVVKALDVEAVNIPEIHEESHRNGNGRNLTPTEARVSTREFAAGIRDACGVACIINHVVVYQSAESLERWLEDSYSHFDIRHFMLVGGESSDQVYPGPSVVAANRLARSLFAGRNVRIGNICIPSRAGETERLRKKIRAGVDFFCTQIIYQLEELLSLFRQILIDGVDTSNKEFYVSFCPVRSVQGIRFLHLLGVTISPELERWLFEDSGITLERSKRHIVDIWKQLLRHIGQREEPLQVGINLSPIGRIDIDETIELGRKLLECSR